MRPVGWNPDVGECVRVEEIPAAAVRRLFGVPWNSRKLTHFIDVDVSGLNVIKNAPHNFLVPGTKSLPLGGRIVNHGASIFK